MQQEVAEVAAPSGLRERKKAQTYDAIMGAALDLFERDGYDATTVEDIADAANVSPRTFFRYFDAKVDVVMDHKGDDEDLGLDKLMALRPAGESPVEALRNVIRGALAPLLVQDQVMVRQVRIMMTTPSLRAMAREHFNEHGDELAEAVSARLDAEPGDLRPHIIAAAFGATIWTVVDLWVTTGGEPDELVDMIDQALALLAAGLD